MDISFHPEPDPDDRKSVRAMMPWWRRALAWLGQYPKFVATLVAVHGSTLVIHAYLKGLVTRAEVDVAVEASVTKATAEALREIRGDLAIIKTNTGGLPEWRGETTKKVNSLEDKLSEARNAADKANTRIDIFLTSRSPR